MRRLLILLGLIGLVVFTSCNKTFKNKEEFSGEQTKSEQKKKGLFHFLSNNKNKGKALAKENKRNTKHKEGLFHFLSGKKNKGKALADYNKRNLSHKGGLFHFLRGKKNKGKALADENKRNLSRKGGLFHFLSGKKNKRKTLADENKKNLSRKGGFLFFKSHKKRSDRKDMDGANINVHRSNKQYDSKHHRLSDRKTFLFFRLKGKHDRQNSNYRGKPNNTIGAYIYNSKKKRVGKKKFLFFFTRYKHQKETSSFSGGEGRHFFRFNLFKLKPATDHKHGLFRRKTEKKFKRKNLNHGLFDPGLHMKI